MKKFVIIATLAVVALVTVASVRRSHQIEQQQAATDAAEKAAALAQKQLADEEAHTPMALAQSALDSAFIDYRFYCNGQSIDDKSFSPYHKAVKDAQLELEAAQMEHYAPAAIAELRDRYEEVRSKCAVAEREWNKAQSHQLEVQRAERLKMSAK